VHTHKTKISTASNSALNFFFFPAPAKLWLQECHSVQPQSSPCKAPTQARKNTFGGRPLGIRFHPVSGDLAR